MRRLDFLKRGVSDEDTPAAVRGERAISLAAALPVLAPCAAILCLARPCWGQITQRVSLGSSGFQANGNCSFAAQSPEGHSVVFSSYAGNLVPGDGNNTWDVFCRDLGTGSLERLSVSSSGGEGNAQSLPGLPSNNAREVTFSSWADNLVANDFNGTMDAFVRDRVLGTTELISLSSTGVEGNGFSLTTGITPDGRYVVFFSDSNNLVPGDTNHAGDVFVRDRRLGLTERVSVGPNGTQGNAESTSGRVSDDGRFVAFVSDSSNLVPADTNGAPDVFVRDRQLALTTRVSVASNGAEGHPSPSAATPCWLSGDGRIVVFSSDASDLVPGDSNGHFDVFAHDQLSGSTERISVAASGVQGNDDSGSRCAVSGDGRYVAFRTLADNLIPGDTNSSSDVLLCDRQSGTLELVSQSSSRQIGNGGSGDSISMTRDGRLIGFDSSATNLVPADTNQCQDVFVRDRLGGTLFLSVCDPGQGGVSACPCVNPPASSGRGCDNSAATGGAVLAASGGAYLSSDSLVFTTSGELPTALSILTQWTSWSATGVVFGMGVRCTAGTFKRLYAKQAAGGSIEAPNFGAGDPQVSTRAAALGDAILAGQSRWYFVYYRDPIVLGGCPPGSTFNATQTGQVTWSP